MKKTFITLLAVSCLGTIALAGETGSSAAARRGSSEAAAWFQGKDGYAKTESRSGWVDFARGTAVSYGKNSLDVSTSYAVHTPRGQTVASSLHIGADRKGAVISGSRVVSQGPDSSAGVGGRITADRAGTSFAVGNTGPRGRVKAESFTRTVDHRTLYNELINPHSQTHQYFVSSKDREAGEEEIARLRMLLYKRGSVHARGRR